MKKRLLVISDIHGEYDLFVRLLRKVDYDPDTCQLILLGDYISKGVHSRQTLNLIVDLVEDGAKAVIGNHEYSFMRWLQGDDSKFRKSMIPTISSYMNYPTKRKKLSKFELDSARRYILKYYDYHLRFIKSLPYYLEDNDHIYIHAGFDPTDSRWRSKSRDMIRIRSRFHGHSTSESKVTIFGHTNCRKLHDSDDPWFQRDKIGIDGAAHANGQLNCLEILDDKYLIHKVLNHKRIKRRRYRYASKL